MRLGRIGVALGALIGLLPLSAHAQADPPKPYSFSVRSLIAGTPAMPTASGTVRRLMPGDAVFTAPMVWEKIANLRAPLAVKVAGVDFAVTPEQRLNWATGGEGGDLASLPAGAPMLCTHDYGAPPSAPGSKRYNKWAVLCLVDSNADGSVDKAFTNASRLPADWHMIDVPPTAYAVQEQVPFGDGAEIRVVYAHGLMFRPVGLQAEPWRQGKHDRFTWAKLDNADGTEGKGRWPFKGAFPRRIELGLGAITLLSFDAKTKVAEIRYERDFAAVGFSFQSDRPNVPITIYY